MLNYCTLYGICSQTLEVRAPFYTHIYLGDITPLPIILIAYDIIIIILISIITKRPCSLAHPPD